VVGGDQVAQGVSQARRGVRVNQGRMFGDLHEYGILGRAVIKSEALEAI
jgi:hypothetical protein